MTEANEERLGTTKNSVLHARNFIGEDGILKFQNGEKVLNDFDWVIERAQELEMIIEKHAPEGRNYTNAQHVEILQENKRLREALKYIANHQTVGEGYEYADQYANSFIAKARQALEGTE
ncbi:hypothetical protein MKY15_19830 [Sporosarcina sp. FSL K6-1540]|uniref:hypothetical protein n=1 Tax=Sporosarcina sp. FSL K6-1540 TaxID=2921555 RepID=UPI003159F18B